MEQPVEQPLEQPMEQPSLRANFFASPYSLTDFAKTTLDVCVLRHPVVAYDTTAAGELKELSATTVLLVTAIAQSAITKTNTKDTDKTRTFFMIFLLP